MAVTMTDIMIVMLAFVICFAVTELTKLYVRIYCKDNPEIIWIWLDDDDDDPEGGCRAKTDDACRIEAHGFSPVPSA